MTVPPLSRAPPLPPAPDARPRSCVSAFDPCLIALVAVGAYILFYALPLATMQLSLLLVAVIALVMAPIEAARSPALTQPRPDMPLRATLGAAFSKTAGILLCVALVLTAWSVIPEYHIHANYRPLFEAMFYVLPALPFVVFAYVFLTEWRLGPDDDQARHFGLIATGRIRQVDWRLIRDGLMVWLVRGFFLPLNFCGLVQEIDVFRGKEAQILTMDWPHLISRCDHMIFAALMVSIVPGYFFDSRLLSTRVKRVDQSWFGWAVTMFCYPPINRGSTAAWFSYLGKGAVMPWIVWLGTTGPAAYTAGVFLLFTYIVHYWGEAICCLRSAHLSSRGIITNGPFRWTKHPVYVIKCVAWTLIYAPFVSSGSGYGNLVTTLCFLAFCAVYGARGWVEERLLSNDPTYVAYALWIEDHGLFRWLGRRFPLMSYRWRLQRWTQRGMVTR